MRPSLARQIVAWYEIAGGTVGAIVTVVFAPGLLARVPSQHRPTTLAVMGVSTVIFVVLALAGFLLLRRRSLGRPLSTAMQLLQVPMWNLFGTSWMFTAGPYFAPALAQAGLGLSIGLKVQWIIQVREAPGPAWVALNFVPLAVLLLLRHSSEEALSLGEPSSSRDPGSLPSASVAPPA